MLKKLSWDLTVGIAFIYRDIERRTISYWLLNTTSDQLFNDNVRTRDSRGAVNGSNNTRAIFIEWCNLIFTTWLTEGRDSRDRQRETKSAYS